MKRTVKIISLLLAILVIGAALTGCNKLDEMRATHAVWTSQDNGDSITLGDKVYKRTKVPSRILNMGKDVILLSITDNDVPVLLSEEFGNTGRLSADGKFITTNGGIADITNAYCLESFCEEFETLYENAVFNKMCAKSYGDYFMVSNEFITAIKTAERCTDKSVMDSLLYRYDLYYCDSSMMFINKTSSIDVRYLDDGSWYVSIISDNDGDYNELVYYKINPVYNELFASVYNEANENVSEYVEKGYAYTERIY